MTAALWYLLALLPVGLLLCGVAVLALEVVAEVQQYGDALVQIGPAYVLVMPGYVAVSW